MLSVSGTMDPNVHVQRPKPSWLHILTTPILPEHREGQYMDKEQSQSQSVLGPSP